MNNATRRYTLPGGGIGCCCCCWSLSLTGEQFRFTIIVIHSPKTKQSPGPVTVFVAMRQQPVPLARHRLLLELFIRTCESLCVFHFGFILAQSLQLSSVLWRRVRFKTGVKISGAPTGHKRKLIFCGGTTSRRKKSIKENTWVVIGYLLPQIAAVQVSSARYDRRRPPSALTPHHRRLPDSDCRSTYAPPSASPAAAVGVPASPPRLWHRWGKPRCTEPAPSSLRPDPRPVIPRW